MIGELLKIAGQCDGVRCDMAMLVLPDVFERTWGRRGAAVLAEGDRSACGSGSPGFRFMAEVYWDLEWTLQQQGFDYAYDKRLYDRLREGHARPVREHLRAGLDYQDEARALPGEPRRAARRRDLRARHARGRGRHHVPVAGPAVLPSGAVRGPAEAHLAAPGPGARWSPSTKRCSSSTSGCSRCSGSRPSATGSGGCSNARRPGTATGRGTASSPGPGTEPDGERLLIAVNYAGHQSQCYVRLPFAELRGRSCGCRIWIGSATYDRSGDDLLARGLYLDLPPWGYHVFDVIGAG